jgi:hypothetical protein
VTPLLPAPATVTLADIVAGEFENEEHAARRIKAAVEYMKDALDRRDTFNLGYLKPETGSQLAADDAVTEPARMSSFVGHQMMTSADLMRTLCRIIQGDGESLWLPIISLFPLIRGIIERAALSLWVLHPEDPQERRLRLLRVLKYEFEEEKHAIDNLNDLIESAGENPTDALTKGKSAMMETHLKFEETLNEIAKACGIRPTKVTRKPQWTEIMNAAAEPSKHFKGRPLIRTEWHSISGLSHPSYMFAMSVTKHKVVGEAENGVLKVETSAKPSILGNQFFVALALLDDAEQLFYSRRMRPEVSPIKKRS